MPVSFLEIRPSAATGQSNLLISATCVIEIVPWRHLTVAHFPGQESWMEGATMFRGNVLSVLSLNKLLSLEDQPDDAHDIGLVLAGSRAPFIARTRAVVGMCSDNDLRIEDFPTGFVSDCPALSHVAQTPDGSSIKAVLDLARLETLAFGAHSS